MKGRLTLVLLFVCLQGFSQRRFEDALGFSQHLVKLQQYGDAVKALRMMDLKDLSSTQIDSLNHFIGFASYLGKQLDSSEIYLDRVSSTSPLYQKSAYYSIISTLYKTKHDYKIAELKLLKMNKEEETRQLWLTQYGGLMLLERDYKRFDSISKFFDHTYYAVVNEQNELERYYGRMMKVKNKSPFVAGALSAVVPGLGKYYAGYRGKALASFVMVSSLALVATESYIRDGYKSPSFIFFSGMFTVFYVGNIWGSTLSVKIKKDETFKEFDRNILLDLHIPLRRIYN